VKRKYAWSYANKKSLNISRSEHERHSCASHDAHAPSTIKRMSKRKEFNFRRCHLYTNAFIGLPTFFCPVFALAVSLLNFLRHKSGHS
jgi:hypothetical protein